MRFLEWIPDYFCSLVSLCRWNLNIVDSTLFLKSILSSTCLLSARSSCTTQPSGSEVIRTDLVHSQNQFSPFLGKLFTWDIQEQHFILRHVPWYKIRSKLWWTERCSWEGHTHIEASHNFVSLGMRVSCTLHACRKTDGKQHQRGFTSDCSFASRCVTHSSDCGRAPTGELLLSAQMHHSYLTKGAEGVRNLPASSNVFMGSLKGQFYPKRPFSFLIRCNLSSFRWH